MTAHPEKEQRINADELRTIVTKVFEHCGMDAHYAGLLVDSLVFADLRGVNSHGVLRVPEYVKKLTNDGVNPRGRPKVVRDSGACMVVSR